MSDEPSEEKKPDTLSIKVVSQVACHPHASVRLLLLTRFSPPQDQTEIFFKCKPHTKMEKLMGAYANRQGVQLRAIRFLFDGERIREDQTPQDIGLEDGDSIDVVMEQVGGSRE